ncbi:hypothetical protein PM082_010590 [Marasmius tenuissimus]|nr:hypothetical protein PM082_010590 [Marasmius tenuissimus]
MATLPGSPISFPSLQDAIRELFVVLEQARVVNYVRLSGVAFLSYDIWLKLEEEVEYIWCSRWSVPKSLYIFARYYGFLFTTLEFAAIPTSVLAPQFASRVVRLPPASSKKNPHLVSLIDDYNLSCRAYLPFYPAAGPIVFTTTVNIILIMRLHALYGRKKKVLAFLTFVLIVEFAFELYISTAIAVAMSRGAIEAPPGINLPGCLSVKPTGLELFAWVPCLIAATLFFSMTIRELFVSLRTANTDLMRARTLSQTLSPLVVTFYQDGAIYFSLITTIVLIGTVTNSKLQGTYSGIAIPWLTPVYSFSGSRLILNLRKAATRAKQRNASWDETLTFRVIASPNVGSETSGESILMDNGIRFAQ